MSNEITREEWLARIKSTYDQQMIEILNAMPTVLRDDKEIMMAAMSNHLPAFHQASRRLQEDFDIARRYILFGGFIGYLDLSRNARENKQTVKIVLRLFTWTTNRQQLNEVFSKIPHKFRNDQAFMLKRIGRNPAAFMASSDLLKDNKSFVMKTLALRQRYDDDDILILREISERLRRDHDVMIHVLKCVGVRSNALEYISERLLDNEDFILEILQFACPQANFGFISNRLLHNKGFILKFLRVTFDDNRQPPVILQHVSDTLKDDMDIVKAAIEARGDHFFHASDMLRDNSAMIRLALAKDGTLLGRMNEKLKQDRNIVMIAVQNDGRALEFASESLQNDVGVVQSAMRSLRGDRTSFYSSSRAFGFAGPLAKKDKETVLLAVKTSVLCLRHAQKNLALDPEIILAVLEESIYWWCLAPFLPCKQLLESLFKGLSSRGETVIHDLYSSSLPNTRKRKRTQQKTQWDAIWIKSTVHSCFLVSKIGIDQGQPIGSLVGVRRKIMEFAGLASNLKDYPCLVKYKEVIELLADEHCSPDNELWTRLDLEDSDTDEG